MKNTASTLVKAAFLGCVGAAAFVQPASAVTVVNGGFETGTPSGAFETIGTGSSAIDGWTIASGSVDWIGSYWQPNSGNQSLDLSGNQPATISQLITGLVMGQAYKVAFALSGNPDGPPPTKNVGVSIDGSSGVFSYAVTGTKANMLWQTFFLSFVATGTEATLQFAALDQGPYGAGLDDVSISAVPVPPALLLLGTGLLGLVARSRKKRTA